MTSFDYMSRVKVLQNLCEDRGFILYEGSEFVKIGLNTKVWGPGLVEDNQISPPLFSVEEAIAWINGFMDCIRFSDLIDIKDRVRNW